MGWAQRRKNRVDLHREHLLAETREQLEIELSSFSARGASSVSCDAELDSPASLAVQHLDFPDAPVVREACGQDSPVVRDAHDRKRRLHVAVQDYPWKFVSPQLLDRDGREILYPVEDDRDRWWARKMECAINHHRDLAIFSVEAKETLLLPYRQCKMGGSERPRPVHISRTQGRDHFGFAPSTGGINSGTWLFPGPIRSQTFHH